MILTFLAKKRDKALVFISFSMQKFYLDIFSSAKAFRFLASFASEDL
jgi:hypothetical protein